MTTPGNPVPESVSLSSRSPAVAPVDALVVGLCTGKDGPTLAPGSAAAADIFDTPLLQQAIAVGATGRTGQLTVLPLGGAAKATRVVVVGLGVDAEAVVPEDLSRAAGAGARALAGLRSGLFVLAGDDPESVEAVATGALLGAYAFTSYRSAVKEPPVQEVVIHTIKARTTAIRDAAERAGVIARSVNQARDWINTPPADLPPAELADQAKTLAQAVGLKVTVLDERRLRRDGYGGIIGVGQGSSNPPRLLRIEYRAGRGGQPRLALIGKGITFDSGGLSLKPGEGMVTMKYDMSGAAAVIAAMLAVAELRPAADVVGYAALAENMPSGTATRPSDVLTMFDGSTVEVLNTDAEGRLVLADAIARAAADDPDVVVDVATLTGAMTVALGTRMAGVMGSDEGFIHEVRRVADSVGESLWPLPIPSEMRTKLDSHVADLANIGDRFGGGLQAAAFLREFVPAGVAWAHLDIAGPAWNRESPNGYTPRGGTGAMVRTLVALAEELGAGTLSVPAENDQ